MLVFIIHCWIISFHPSPADSDHLFFLHNRYLESNDLNRPHDVYGKMEYNEIITAFKANGFEVHNEIRPTNTDPKVYAQKIKLEIENLISSGVSLITLLSWEHPKAAILLSMSPKISRYQDIAINTGLSHGFLFKAMKEWIDPTALWAYRKYDEIHE
ncbi:MAG: hypothetical protein IPP89_08495 [Saprospiraceae bacterium]|nr:hypothetical protein [Candidatus Brachybacter algidus]MBL0119009.1 hypothetical protein [Candidatus Brachybacter algidus]